MMMKDFRYVIKKILIGVGICLCLFYLKSCHVYAIESNQYNTLFYNEYSHGPNDQHYAHYVGQKYQFVIDGNEYNIEYKRCGTQGSIGLYINDFEVDCSINSHKNAWIIGKFVSSGNVTLYYGKPNGGYNASYQLPIILNYPYNFPLTTSTICASNMSSGSSRVRVNFENGVYSSSNTSSVSYGPYNYNGENYYNCILGGWDFIVFGSDARLGLFGSSNRKWISSNFDSPNYSLKNPYIVSLNPTLNKTDEGMLVSVSFDIEFSYVDTENYNYYAWFEGYDKFSLTENYIHLNTQSNTNLYVEITDKQGNNIDSETFNVSSIGLIYDGDFDIQYSVQEFSDSDFSNDSDAFVDYINRVDIDTTFIPKWINYRYYYQFVNSGQSLDENSWILLNNNTDDNNIVYTTHNNGTLYTKIEDIDNNVLFSSTFDVSRIGVAKVYDKNSGKIFNMFNRIKDEVNFGGPISNLIVAPVNILETILQATTNTCVPYDMGSIRGHRIVLDCIEPDDYLGGTLWSTIDIIVSFCLSWSMIKWITSLYYGFVILQNTPDIDDSHFDRKSNSLF